MDKELVVHVVEAAEDAGIRPDQAKKIDRASEG